MKKHELASDYMKEYDGTDVTIADVTIGPLSEQWVAFDTSDGRHWFSDDCFTGETTRSLCDAEITNDLERGWLADGEEIAWVG